MESARSQVDELTSAELCRHYIWNQLQQHKTAIDAILDRANFSDEEEWNIEDSRGGEETAEWRREGGSEIALEDAPISWSRPTISSTGASCSSSQSDKCAVGSTTKKIPRMKHRKHWIYNPPLSGSVTSLPTPKTINTRSSPSSSTAFSTSASAMSLYSPSTMELEMEHKKATDRVTLREYWRRWKSSSACDLFSSDPHLTAENPLNDNLGMGGSFERLSGNLDPGIGQEKAKESSDINGRETFRFASQSRDMPGITTKNTQNGRERDRKAATEDGCKTSSIPEGNSTQNVFRKLFPGVEMVSFPEHACHQAGYSQEFRQREIVEKDLRADPSCKTLSDRNCGPGGELSLDHQQKATKQAKRTKLDQGEQSVPRLDLSPPVSPKELNYQNGEESDSDSVRQRVSHSESVPSESFALWNKSSETRPQIFSEEGQATRINDPKSKGRDRDLPNAYSPASQIVSSGDKHSRANVAYLLIDALPEGRSKNSIGHCVDESDPAVEQLFLSKGAKQLCCDDGSADTLPSLCQANENIIMNGGKEGLPSSAVAMEKAMEIARTGDTMPTHCRGLTEAKSEDVSDDWLPESQKRMEPESQASETESDEGPREQCVLRTSPTANMDTSMESGEFRFADTQKQDAFGTAFLREKEFEEPSALLRKMFYSWARYSQEKGLGKVLAVSHSQSRSANLLRRWKQKAILKRLERKCQRRHRTELMYDSFKGWNQLCLRKADAEIRIQQIGHRRKAHILRRTFTTWSASLLMARKSMKAQTFHTLLQLRRHFAAFRELIRLKEIKQQHVTMAEHLHRAHLMKAHFTLWKGEIWLQKERAFYRSTLLRRGMRGFVNNRRQIIGLTAVLQSRRLKKMIGAWRKVCAVNKLRRMKDECICACLQKRRLGMVLQRWRLAYDDLLQERNDVALAHSFLRLRTLSKAWTRLRKFWEGRVQEAAIAGTIVLRRKKSWLQLWRKTRREVQIESAKMELAVLFEAKASQVKHLHQWRLFVRSKKLHRQKTSQAEMWHRWTSLSKSFRRLKTHKELCQKWRMEYCWLLWRRSVQSRYNRSSERASKKVIQQNHEVLFSTVDENVFDSHSVISSYVTSNEGSIAKSQDCASAFRSPRMATRKYRCTTTTNNNKNNINNSNDDDDDARFNAPSYRVRIPDSIYQVWNIDDDEYKEEDLSETSNDYAYADDEEDGGLDTDYGDIDANDSAELCRADGMVDDERTYKSHGLNSPKTLFRREEMTSAGDQSISDSLDDSHEGSKYAHHRTAGLRRNRNEEREQFDSLYSAEFDSATDGQDDLPSGQSPSFKVDGGNRFPESPSEYISALRGTTGRSESSLSSRESGSILPNHCVFASPARGLTREDANEVLADLIENELHRANSTGRRDLQVPREQLVDAALSRILALQRRREAILTQGNSDVFSEKLVVQAAAVIKDRRRRRIIRTSFKIWEGKTVLSLLSSTTGRQWN